MLCIEIHTGRDPRCGKLALLLDFDVFCEEIGLVESGHEHGLRQASSMRLGNVVGIEQVLGIFTEVRAVTVLFELGQDADGTNTRC